jgi:hypothetical protein
MHITHREKRGEDAQNIIEEREALLLLQRKVEEEIIKIE